jgi:ubiquinone/menaquinone biosynthesis C-methylase UbiE
MRRTVGVGKPFDFECERTVSKRLKFILHCFDSIASNQLNVLDLGVGHGVYIEQILQLCKIKRYIGVDIFQDHLQAIKEGTERESQSFQSFNSVLASAEALPFHNETLDVVLLIEVLEHVQNDKVALKEIHRVLAPGGVLILTTPNKLFPLETHGFKIGLRVFGTRGFGFPLLPLLPESLRAYVANARVYTPNRLKRMISDAGFDLEEIGFISPNLDILSKNFKSKAELIKILEGLEKIFDGLEKNRLLQHFMESISIRCSKR